MKPDLTDDIELERLPRDSPAGPEGLAAAKQAHAPRTRRGAVAIALVAAVVLGFAGIAALLPIRQAVVSQSPATTSSTTLPASAFDFVTGGWGWRGVADPAPGVVAPVANGFLGECLASGLPAACTSRDGVAWTLPPDPAVLTVDGGGFFAGWSVAHGPAGWVAAGTVDPGTWRSSDGVHWSKVAVDLPGLQHAQVQALPAGFAMFALTRNGGQQTVRLLITTDGAAWTPVDLPAGISEVRLAGAVGLVGSRVENGTSAAGAVSSADGRTWTALTLPDGVGSLSTTIRLGSGAYVGVGTVGTMVTSTDGVAWRASDGPGSAVDSLALVGGRLLAIARVPSTDIPALWESPDGTSWQRVALLQGNPLSGTQLVSLGDRVGILSGSKLTAVGWPGVGGTATGSATAIATPATPAPRSAPGVIVGGWRWQRLSGGPDGNSSVVRVTNGYFGRCGNAMCTSPDGWSWKTPPDPAVFATDGVALFTPISVAHDPNGGYVVSAAEGVWYSMDGVRWQAAKAPAAPHGFRAVMYGPGGFTLVGETPTGEKSQLYSSPDGASWTDAGLGPMVITLAEGDTSGGLFTQTGKSSTGGVFGYSADGRTWVTSTIPAGANAYGSTYRLTGGSLMMGGGPAILRSTDGRVWTQMKTGWVPDSLAMAGGRIVATAVGSDGTSAAWESSDNGKTFHKMMDGVGQVEQFADLVLLRTSTAGSWVGAPLSPGESPGTTPTATGLPVSSISPPPAYTPPPTPTGGISKEEAIRIAVNAIHPPADQVATARASVVKHPRYGWVWSVSFSRDAPSPTGGSGTFVDINFYTGEVLASGDWIS